ncbi:TPR repeat protein oca3 [Cyberlindnera fabianii]|uniref:ER membrane protein complex subunit 2 n=1 Tax=Cyberlindnera fabianii TaxID=36022 RepID=A0A1V2L243_CYBFA|nr:TPR repeat protein oca3 [Cyberlindnera fabianii]
MLLHRRVSIDSSISLTWAELGEAYYNAGHFDKAVHCYHEVLLQQSFNYYAFARIGELEHAAFVRDGDVERLESSTKHYLRSVELCSNLVRSWAGVFVTTAEMAKLDEKKKKKVELDYEELHSVAKKQLEKIIKTENAPYADIEAAKKVIS